MSPTLNAGNLQSAILMANDILAKKASLDQRQQNSRQRKSSRNNTKTSATTLATTTRKKLAKNATSNAKSSNHQQRSSSTISTSTKPRSGSSIASSRRSEPLATKKPTGSVDNVHLDDISVLSDGSSKCHSANDMASTTTSRDDGKADLASNNSTHQTANTTTRSSDAKEDLLANNSNHSRSDFFFQHSIVVDNIWQNVKNNLVDYEHKIGEQILLRMMEMDPNARQEMRLKSLRSPRFDELTKMLVVVVDLMVSVFGPNLDEYAQDLELLGQECTANGIQISLLTNAVTDALQLALVEENIPFDADDRESWTLVVETVSQGMKVGA